MLNRIVLGAVFAVLLGVIAWGAHKAHLACRDEHRHEYEAKRLASEYHSARTGCDEWALRVVNNLGCFERDVVVRVDACGHREMSRMRCNGIGCEVEP